MPVVVMPYHAARCDACCLAAYPGMLRDAVRRQCQLAGWVARGDALYCGACVAAGRVPPGKEGDAAPPR